jgi:type IV pilus assembly protein PilO
MAKSFHEISSKAQLVVFILLSALTLGGAWKVLFSPMMAELETRRTYQQLVESNLASARGVADRLPQIEREVRELELALHQTTAVIPDEKDPQDVLRHLHELASVSMLNLASFNPKPVVSKPQYSEWPIEIGFEGNFHDLGMFFGRIATMSRLMSVSDLKIQVRQRQGGRGTVSVSCLATTFVFKKDPAPVVTGDRP